MKIVVQNRQRVIPVDVPWLRKIARAAGAEIFERWLNERAPLAKLENVDVTIIDDEVIAKVHAQFFGDPSPTDVISFDYGEILISAETAKANAARFQTTTDREIALYLIHGLLHIDGYDDTTAAAARKMKMAQEKILACCLEKIGVGG